MTDCGTRTMVVLGVDLRAGKVVDGIERKTAASMAVNWVHCMVG